MLHNAHLAGDTFWWDGGPVGVLLVHGYTATTAEVRPLGQKLHQQNYTVTGPLLPGHGTTPAEMNRCRWEDWAGHLETVYQALAARCRRVFVGGESMGAVLALQLASRHPEIAGVLAYAPALKIPWRSLLLSYLARPFISHVPKSDAASLNPNWQGYGVNPIPALHQLHRLQREVYRCKLHIRQPLLIVQGRLDKDIDLPAVELWYQQADSPLKELHWLEKSSHVVLLDQEFEQVAAITLKFMERALAV